MGVIPEYRGLGAARTYMEWGMEEAQRMKCPVSDPTLRIALTTNSG